HAGDEHAVWIGASIPRDATRHQLFIEKRLKRRRIAAVLEQSVGRRTGRTITLPAGRCGALRPQFSEPQAPRCRIRPPERDACRDWYREDLSACAAGEASAAVVGAIGETARRARGELLARRSAQRFKSHQ